MGVLEHVSRSKLRQYIIIITANLSFLCLGMSAVWPSPVLVMLQNETKTPLPSLVTDEEASWIVSIYYLSALSTLLLTTCVVNKIGKKQCLVLGFLPRIASAFVGLFATNYQMLLITRVLNGVADVLVIVTVGPYTAEIASKEIRGSLGTISQIQASLGMLIIYSIGPKVTYFTLNLMLTSIVLISFFPILFLPESPYFLYSKGRSKDAFAVLKLLGNSESSATPDLKEHNVENVNLDMRGVLRDRKFIKATILGVVIATGTHLVGYNCVLIYLQTVLEWTHTNIESGTASMIVGLLQLLGSILSSLVIDRFGRRPVLIITLIGMALGMIGLGVFFTIVKCNEDSIDGFLNFLPLFSLASFVLFFNLGAGSIYLILIAELMGSSYRTVGTSICVYVATAASFFTTRYFTAMISAVGSAATFFIFSAICLIFCIFIGIFVPETRKKTFGEIQSALDGSVCQVKCLNNIGD